MVFIPLFHQVKQQKVLVVGGGKVALRKAKYFIEQKLIVDVLSPVINTELRNLINLHNGQWFEQIFNHESCIGEQLTTYWCIVASTDDSKVNQQVASFAKKNKIMVNVVDNTALCDFILPSTIIDESLIIAISNSGCSPVLSRIIKKQIEQLLPSGYGRLSNFVGKHRVLINQSIADHKNRLNFWQKTLQGDIAQMVMAGNTKNAEEHLMIALTNPIEFNNKGTVSVLAINVTEADLLSLRTLRAIKQAEVAVYHPQVSDEIIALFDKACQQIIDCSVSEFLSQESEQKIVELAKEGKRVVYLTATTGKQFLEETESIRKLAKGRFTFQSVP